MQHSAVDLENYARLYVADRLRDSARLRLASEVVAEPTWLERAVARVYAWFTPSPQEHLAPVRTPSQPAQLVPILTKPQAAADPYAGMIVLVRGPKEPCTLDAA